jgi:hypothetical protein
VPSEKVKRDSRSRRRRKNGARTRDDPDGAEAPKLVPPRPAKPEPSGPDLFHRVFNGEATTEVVLLETAIALDFLAKRSASPIDIAVARAIDALWLATRRRDETRLAQWGRDAFKFLQTRTADERWTGSALPPQASLDRSIAMNTLLFVAKGLLAEHPKPTESCVGEIMSDAVARLFPNLCPDFISIAEADEARKRIEVYYKRELKMAGDNGRSFDDHERLVSGSLRAFDVSATDAWNWIKGATISRNKGDIANDPKPSAQQPLARPEDEVKPL